MEGLSKLLESHFSKHHRLPEIKAWAIKYSNVMQWFNEVKQRIWLRCKENTKGGRGDTCKSLEFPNKGHLSALTLGKWPKYVLAALKIAIVWKGFCKCAMYKWRLLGSLQRWVLCKFIMLKAINMGALTQIVAAIYSSLITCSFWVSSLVYGEVI